MDEIWCFMDVLAGMSNVLTGCWLRCLSVGEFYEMC